MAKRKVVAAILIGLMVVAGGFYPLYADLIRGEEWETLEVKFKVDLPVFEALAREGSFEFTGEFPEVEDEVMVYKVIGPDVTTEKVTEMGRRLGFEGEAEAYPDMIAMTDESGGETRWFAVWVNSGAVEYHFVEPDKLYPSTPPSLPSDEEAKEIATRFLAEAGLLPLGVYASEVVVGGSYGGIEGEWVAHLLVRFDYEINGFPVTGLGAKFGVRIGDKGEVVDMFLVWREVEPYGKIPIKTPHEAYQELVAGGGSCVSCEKAVVEKISLAYWMEVCSEKQEYTVPVYEFKGKCLDENGEYVEDFLGWCEADP